MEDEVFEKYYLQIENVFSVFGDYDYDIPEWKRKQKIKQILEEIYNKGYANGYCRADIRKKRLNHDQAFIE